MTDVAELHPYRDGNRVMFRGNIGAGGVTKFAPYRLTGKVFLRGAASDGKIVHGYIDRKTGRAFGRAAWQTTGYDCGSGCLFQTSYTVTVSGITGSGSDYDWTVFNGTWTLSLSSGCLWSVTVPGAGVPSGDGTITMFFAGSTPFSPIYSVPTNYYTYLGFSVPSSFGAEWWRQSAHLTSCTDVIGLSLPTIIDSAGKEPTNYGSASISA